MSLQLIPLGTNGFFPSFGRQTMSFLVLGPDQAMVLDAGTGIARLLEPGIKELLRSYDCLDIILSHYHLDHVIGLSFLPGIWTQGRIRIFAPAPPFVDAQPHHTLDQLLRPPLYSLTIDTFPVPVEIIPLDRERVRVGAVDVCLWPQKHPGGSAGIRIADHLVYITDTIVEEKNQIFVRGAEVLLHEVWLTDTEAEKDPVERSRHSYVSAVADFAKRAGVEKLMPIHHHPKRSGAEISSLVQTLSGLSGVPTVIPEEGRSYEL